MAQKYKTEIDLLTLVGVPLRVTKEMSRLEGELSFAKINPEQSTFICGRAGSGKTLLAAHAMFCSIKADIGDLKYLLERPDHAIEQGYIPFNDHLFASVSKLLFAIRQTYGPAHPAGAATEDSIVNTYSKVRWLLLDDLGTERSTEWSFETLYLIINERYDNDLVTFITCNHSLDKLAEKMGDDRLVSRIAGMCEIFTTEDVDYRITGKE